jgi:colanic acid/amylovoran biosynthesis glycosyltransferase
MKIAFVVDQFPALSESFIISQITGLIDEGHRVDIHAGKNPHEATIHQAVREYRLLEHTYYSPSLPNSIHALRLKTLFLLIIHFFRSPVAISKIIYALLLRSRRTNYPMLYRMFSLIHRRYDIIHAHFGPSGKIGEQQKRIGNQTPLVTTIHGYDISSYIETHGKAIYDDLKSEGDCFTFNSEATKEKMTALGFPPQRMTKLPMGVDLTRYPFREREIGSDQHIYLLSVGRLVEMKGREYSIKAVAKVLEHNPKIVYNIIGDGNQRRRLEALIDELNVQDNIKIHGWVSDDELDAFYEQSHIMLHTSVTDQDGCQEGQGVVLLEAQALGMPVVATDHSAFPETIRGGYSGYLAPERDVEALAQKLKYLIDNPGRWPTMGRHGRNHVETNYNVLELNSQLIGIYEDLIGTE